VSSAKKYMSVQFPENTCQVTHTQPSLAGAKAPLALRSNCENGTEHHSSSSSLPVDQSIDVCGKCHFRGKHEMRMNCDPRHSWENKTTASRFARSVGCGGSERRCCLSAAFAASY
jgi:hypothetical protein